MERTSVELVALDGITRAKRNRAIDKGSLKELVDSVREHGVLSPVLVRPVNGKKELVFGHRRFLAAKEAGLGVIPAMVREMTDAQALEAQIIENCQRQDVHPLEEAEDFERLHREFGYTADDIAAKIGKSRSHVYGRLKLCELTKAGRKVFLDGKLTPSVALLLARIPDDLQPRALKDLTYQRWGNPRRELENPLSYREAAALIQQDYMLRLAEASFPTTDAELVPAAGSCSTCPKRTGNQRELFEDVASADVCTDPACFRAKLDAHWERVKATSQEKGLRVLTDAETKKVFPGEFHKKAAWSSGFVGLEDGCLDVDSAGKAWGKKYRELLKAPLKAGELDIAIARDPAGKTHKLIAEKEAKAALRKLGLLKRENKSSDDRTSSSKRDSKRDKLKSERIRKTAKAAVEQSITAIESRKPDVGLWRLIASLVWQLADTGAGTDVLKRRQIPVRAVEARIAKAKEPELRGLVVELLMASGLENEGIYEGASFGGTDFPRELRDVAKFCRVDLKKLEATIGKELEREAAAAKGGAEFNRKARPRKSK